MQNKYLDDDVVVVGAKRTIVGSTGGPPRELGHACLGHSAVLGLLKFVESNASIFSREELQHFVVGLCIGAGIGQNLPRQITQRLGLESIESAYVVNEMCGSGLESIIHGINAVKTGEYVLSIAGGVEDPSSAPYLITTKQLIDWKDRSVGEIQSEVVRADMFDALWCKMYDVHTIVHAEESTANWVSRNKIDESEFKQKIDEYAVMSHQRALDAISSGLLKEEIVPVDEMSNNDELPTKKNIKILSKRAGTQFTPEGKYLSNHNSPPLASNAAFIMLMKYSKAKEMGLEPMARINGYTRAGISPRNFLLAPIDAVRKLLNQTETKISDYDLLEMNTAFGSQMIINEIELGLDMNKVNVYGDCIAYGHPIGAAGGRLATTLLHAMKREGPSKGLVSMCLGGGNAIAMAFERLGE